MAKVPSSRANRQQLAFDQAACFRYSKTFKMPLIHAYDVVQKGKIRLCHKHYGFGTLLRKGWERRVLPTYRVETSALSVARPQNPGVAEKH